MRILVTGSRYWSDYDTFVRGLTVAIETLADENPDDKNIVVVHGGAPGADVMSERYVAQVQNFLSGKGYTIRTEVHPAEWDKYGKAAGPIRNQKMVDLGADLVVAFFRKGAQSRGTANCVAAAERAGLRVNRYEAQ